MFGEVVVRIRHISKKDGCYEPFNKDKLRRGLQLACLKRPVSLAEIERVVDKISRHILEQNEKSVTANDIGQLVMQELKTLDDVAYVRFASVYRSFRDINEFVQTLEMDPSPTPAASANTPNSTTATNS